jgi:hypothetical protein
MNSLASTSRSRSSSFASPYQTPRSKALHDWRLALKFGDRDAERKALDRMDELGIDFEARRSSVRNAHPLGSISIKDRAAYLDTLSADERRQLDEAIDWYEATYLD